MHHAATKKLLVLTPRSVLPDSELERVGRLPVVQQTILLEPARHVRQQTAGPEQTAPLQVSWSEQTAPLQVSWTEQTAPLQVSWSEQIAPLQVSWTEQTAPLQVSFN